MLKKVLAAVSSLALLSSYAGMAVSAEDTTTAAKDKVYKYVAMGDSIASGYGLTEVGSMAQDPALILTEELLTNPVKEAYPAVFGTYLDEIAAGKGYTARTTNIASTAYRAEDIEQTILTPGYKGEIATFIFETFLGNGASAPLSAYHDIYTDALSEADLVSIQLGGNDIVMSIVFPMVMGDNPILQAAGTSMALVLFGVEPEMALGAGYQILANNKDNITEETVAEAAEYFSAVQENASEYVDSAAENVGKVVDAVKGVNADADIAILGMFNPYDQNAWNSEEQLEELLAVLQDIFTEAVEGLIGDIDVDIPDIEIEKIKAEGDVMSLELADDVDDFKTLIDGLMEEIDPEELKALLEQISDEIFYPMAVTLAGRNVDPQIQLLNEKMEALAAEQDAVYVDVYSVTPEQNLDPHPEAPGHVEIADLMKAALEDLVASRMIADEPDSSSSEPDSSSVPDSSSEPESTPDSSSAPDSSSVSAADSSSIAPSTSSTAPSTSSTTAVAKTGGNPETGAAAGALYAGTAILIAAAVMVRKKSR